MVVERGCDTYAIAAWLVQPTVASSVVLLAGSGGHVGLKQERMAEKRKRQGNGSSVCWKEEALG